MEILGMALAGLGLWVIVSCIFFDFSGRFLTHVSDKEKVLLRNNQTLELEGETAVRPRRMVDLKGDDGEYFFYYKSID